VNRAEFGLCTSFPESGTEVALNPVNKGHISIKPPERSQDSHFKISGRGLKKRDLFEGNTPFLCQLWQSERQNSDTPANTLGGSVAKALKGNDYGTIKENPGIDSAVCSE
jgi:hypothetical protein